MFDRKIDLKAYLPDTLKNIAEMQAIMDTETPEIEKLWQACEDCLNDQFIPTATKNGIARYEKMLGLKPFASDTLEDRRFRLLTRYSESVPYTRRSLASLLDSLCGKDGYTLSFDTAAFTVSVEVALTNKKQVSLISDMLERILPYNMAFTVTVLYNEWAKYQSKTWTDLAAKTWKQIKEEVTT